ncbi:solute carrier family 23 protein [Escherichia coli]
MSVSTLESENAQPVAQTQNSELIYRLEDRPPLPQTLFAACQHLLAMFVAVITPALLICQALGLPAQDTQHIISMSLFASGVRIVSREPLNRRAILIIALSLAVGLGVSQQPLILQFAPEWLKNLLSSGIAAGGITAIVLNLIFPPEKQ